MEGKDLICIPGQRLCLADSTHSVGSGTYERQGYIYSSQTGVVHVIKQEKGNIIEVRSINDQSIVPAPGNIVTAKVMVVNQRFAKCLITCIGDTVLTRPYRGILRKEDVRSFEKDRVEMYKCYRPGDIILARILPISEMHTYQLTTAENELGVVIAYSEAGVALIPISWTCMQCPKTYNKEERKVAKVVPEKIILD
ncbi:exosome complex component CSL4-like [Homalodisca vitripennis]|uniref:exosome complex component CSL4-like n=1 Tax=Homalodisca vitripennis TaxID=197043 RepID=UPI001EEB1FBB|nr:exosome complex component CSL4-like [Homalodisca vitripennis]XP_046688221.1 exosome complex component CSL4-like [Homalodisca vitripennis]KAG8336219.1 Exosome complex component CSL4 [Homalodisca vitripennis]